MIQDRVTFLTRPVLGPVGAGFQVSRQAARVMWYALRLRRPPYRARFGGHPAVTRSVVHGLDALGFQFNIDPPRSRDVARKCHVLSDLNALAQAIEWKRAGRIDRLTAGPNLVVLPSDCPELLSAPELDLLLVNSKWTSELYVADLPSLVGRCAIWPAGVDVDYWAPASGSFSERSALIYVKAPTSELIERAEQLVARSGYVTTRIVYGSYTAEQYRAALRESSFAIFFSEQESQGIALAEAWACDVPTLVWDRRALVTGQNGRPTGVCSSSAPFLTDACGLAFSDIAELPKKLELFLKRVNQFQPRQRVVQELSDSATSAMLWKLIGEAT